MHYSVLILGPDPEGQLDPYWELDLTPGELAADYRAVFDCRVPADRFEADARLIIALREPHDPALATRYRRLLETAGPEAVFAAWYGGQKGPDGDWGFYSNPDAKWDWCLLGGRFQGLLHLLPGHSGIDGERSWTNADQPQEPGTCDQARFGDIDWPATRRGFTPFAVLKDGWQDQGPSGLLPADRDPAADAAWEAEVDALLSGPPPDTLVSVYDCHI